MTPAEFIAEAVTFPLGEVVVISGADEATVTSLLTAAKTAIETSTTKSVLLFNSRDTVPYPDRHFVPDTTPSGGRPASSDASRLREFDVVASDSQFVILIANQFDINDTSEQNRYPVNLIIDTVLDLFRPDNVSSIIYSEHRYYGVIREMYAYLTKIYHYDTTSDVVTFIKNQNPHRP